MKKILFTLILSFNIIFILTIGANAAYITGAYVEDIDNGVIVVEGTTENEDSVLFYLVKKGVAVELGNYYDGNVLSIQSVDLMEDGSFSHRFVFNGESGEYYIYATGGELPYGPITLITKAELEQFANDFVDGNITDSEFYGKLEFFASSLGVDLSFVKSDADKSYIKDRFKNNSEAIAQHGFYIMKPLAVKIQNELKLFSNIAESVTTSGVNLAFFDYYTAIKTYVENSNMSDEFNEFLLRADFDYATYSSLDDVKKTVVCDKLMGNEYTDMLYFAQQFTAAIESSNNSGSNNPGASVPGSSPVGGGVGSSFGGSSGGGGGRLNPATQMLPDKSTLLPANEQTKQAFSDIGGVEWAKEAIEYMKENNIMTGTDENHFEPDSFITREQFAKIIVIAFDLYNENAACDFSDIDSDNWAYKYAASAYENNIIYGIGDGKFGYGNTITREDIAVMLYRCIIKSGKQLTNIKNDFTDTPLISDYAKEAVEYMAGEGYINGMGNNTFVPKEFATRAQAAKLLYAIIKGE